MKRSEVREYIVADRNSLRGLRRELNRALHPGDSLRHAERLEKRAAKILLEAAQIRAEVKRLSVVESLVPLVLQIARVDKRAELLQLLLRRKAYQEMDHGEIKWLANWLVSRAYSKLLKGK